MRYKIVQGKHQRKSNVRLLLTEVEKILEVIIHLEVKVATVGDEQVRLFLVFFFF